MKLRWEKDTPVCDYSMVYGGGSYDYWFSESRLESRFGLNTLNQQRFFSPWFGTRLTITSKIGLCKILQDINPRLCSTPAVVAPESMPRSNRGQVELGWVVKRDAPGLHQHSGKVCWWVGCCRRTHRYFRSNMF